MAKPNYSYEKRQRELAKKRKKEEKAARKSGPRPAEGETVEGADASEDTSDAGVAPAGDETPPSPPAPSPAP